MRPVKSCMGIEIASVGVSGRQHHWLLKWRIVSSDLIERSRSRSGILVQEKPMTKVECDSRPRPSVPQFALFPSPVPRHELAYVKKIQPVINQLYDNVSRDHEFLRKTLKRVVEADEFTRQLFKILDTVDEEGVSQETSFCIYRSDYMIESRPEVCHSLTRMKQTEVNTIACALGTLADRFPQLHRYVVSLRDGVRKDNYEHEMPDQPIGEGMAEGLATAWKQYGSSSAVVVLLLNKTEKNTFEMYDLDAYLLLNHGIKLVQFTFDDVVEGAPHQAKLREDGALIVGGYEAAVTYFRTAYSPTHYPSQKYWDVRLMFERSRSIQCPSVALQLAGSKKVQEELGRPGVLEKFLSSADDVEQVQATFLNMYTLDQTPEGDAAAAKAIAKPSVYILKRQREGGEGNLFGDAVRSKLIELQGSKERDNYTMQDRIFPVLNKNYSVFLGKLDELDEVEVVDEIGIVGAFVRNGDKVVLNSVPGHFFRGEIPGIGDGKILGGTAVFSSPWLH